jgi:hypothetical protein
MAVIAGAAFALALISPQVRQVGLDVWNAAAHREALRTEEAVGTDLAGQQDRLRDQARASDAIVRRLIESRVSLAGAVDELAEINVDRVGLIRTYFQGETDRELFARYSFNKVCVALEGDASRAEAVLPRLRAEFRALFPDGEPLKPLSGLALARRGSAR